VRCKTCHYSLANLGAAGPPHRCPECGTPFDPNDPSTFVSANTKRLAPIVVARCAITFVATIVFVYVITSVSEMFMRPSFLVLVLFGGLVTFLAFPILLLFSMSELRREQRSKTD
jgi:hypothetical protein